MTQENIQVNFEQLGRSLNNCYERLRELLQEEIVNPEELERLTRESQAIISVLTKALPNSEQPAGLNREKLAQFKHRNSLLIDQLKNRLAEVKKNIGKLQTGRKALDGYRPKCFGMGYTEGKFIDSKK